jgi:hypothetical protein
MCVVNSLVIHEQKAVPQQHLVDNININIIIIY